MSEYDKAMKAIRNLFGDTSVDPLETRRDLEALRDEIEMKLDILPR